MGNYILDFVDKELLKHRKKKEKLNQEESSYILKETIRKQEEINKQSSKIEEEKDIKIRKTEKKENKKKLIDIPEKESQRKEKKKEENEEKKEIKQEKKVRPKVIMTTMMDNYSLEELTDEIKIPIQQKNKDSIVSKDIMNILEGNNMEQSILSFNEEENMNINTSDEEKFKKKTKEKKIAKKKSKMKTILFQAIIGVVLIIISVFYLVDSPAEQKVLKSGMSIWIDKIKMLLGNSNEYFHDKFLTDLDENKKKLLLDIDNSLEKVNDCELSGGDLKKDIQQLESLRNAIDAMSLERFKEDHMMIDTQVQGIINGDIIKKCY